MTRLRSLGLIHIAGNAILLWLGYYWLGIGESKTSILLWNFVLGLFTLALFCWLHGAGFAFFRGPTGNTPLAFRSSLRNLVPILTVSIVTVVIYFLVDRAQDWSSGPAFSLASWLTLHLRKPFKPASMIRAFGVGWWIVRWVVLPVLILPAVSAISVKGWHGIRSVGPVRGYKLIWIETPLLLLCAVWAPLKLMGWHPVTSGFGPEMFSFIVRLLVAHLFFVIGCLALEFSAAGGSLRWRHSEPAVSPATADPGLTA